jgi:hypothetical protein
MFQLEFHCTNNIAKYEALCGHEKMGMQLHSRFWKEGTHTLKDLTSSQRKGMEKGNRTKGDILEP